MDLPPKIKLELDRYERGECARGEVMNSVLDAITLDNVEAIVDALPVEWRAEVVADFVERAKATSPDELITIVAGVFAWEHEPDESRRAAMIAEHEATLAAERHRYWWVTLPAIRAWLEGPASSLK